jgi:hypothetical protein
MLGYSTILLTSLWRERGFASQRHSRQTVYFFTFKLLEGFCTFGAILREVRRPKDIFKKEENTGKLPPWETS